MDVIEFELYGYPRNKKFLGLVPFGLGKRNSVYFGSGVCTFDFRERQVAITSNGSSKLIGRLISFVNPSFLHSAFHPFVGAVEIGGGKVETKLSGGGTVLEIVYTDSEDEQITRKIDSDTSSVDFGESSICINPKKRRVSLRTDRPNVDLALILGTIIFKFVNEYLPMSGS